MSGNSFGGNRQIALTGAKDVDTCFKLMSFHLGFLLTNYIKMKCSLSVFHPIA